MMDPDKQVQVSVTAVTYAHKVEYLMCLQAKGVPQVPLGTVELIEIQSQHESG